MESQQPIGLAEGQPTSVELLHLFDKMKTIRAFVFDVDGVFTNNNLLVTESGELLRVMNVRDGQALKWAVRAGYHTSVITGGRSEGVKKRLLELGVHEYHSGIEDKWSAFQSILKAAGIRASEVAYLATTCPTCPSCAALPCLVALLTLRLMCWPWPITFRRSMAGMASCAKCSRRSCAYKGAGLSFSRSAGGANQSHYEPLIYFFGKKKVGRGHRRLFHAKAAKLCALCVKKKSLYESPKDVRRFCKKRAGGGLGLDAGAAEAAFAARCVVEGLAWFPLDALMARYHHLGDAFAGFDGLGFVGQVDHDALDFAR